MICSMSTCFPFQSGPSYRFVSLWCPSARFLGIGGSRLPFLTEAMSKTGGMRRLEFARGHAFRPSSLCAYVFSL